MSSTIISAAVALLIVTVILVVLLLVVKDAITPKGKVKIDINEGKKVIDVTPEKPAKKKAKVAVARSLAVTIVALLKGMTKEYIPLSKAGEEGFKRYHAELEYLTMQKAAKKEKAEKKAKAA